ncbi:MAG TPA: PemK family transcriptional regulator, partial [Clostridiaceae bacterium]|nr:PemK family transcriptional regulator [Clostridiaceae bacterium]
MTMAVKRGDIFYADLSPVIGSEQGGVRPVLIVQNDIGNKYSPTVIIAAITSQINKAKLPTHIEISSAEYGLNKDSVILLEQVRTIDKRRLK